MKQKNEHGRIGVKRKRWTRKQLRSIAYQEGYNAGLNAAMSQEDSAIDLMVADHHAFLRKLAKESRARQIHILIKQRLDA